MDLSFLPTCRDMRGYVAQQQGRPNKSCVGEQPMCILTRSSESYTFILYSTINGVPINSLN